MQYSNGFIDLRMDAQHRQSDDTVWPSFTDIMTVVVMIFLFALVVIVVRNVELVNQLRATMEAERAAAEIARTTEEQKESLAVRLVDLEEQLSRLRLELMQSQETQQDTSAKLGARIRELSQVQSERDAARNQAQQLSSERDALSARLQTATADNRALTEARASLEQRVGQVNQELATLQERESRQAAELTQLRQQQTGRERALASLQGEYTSLKKKYDRLVRPARTALGKYVVEVRYRKAGGRFEIGLREPKQDQYRVMSADELHRVLGGLKQQWAGKLYTKIVIPDNSGLSYTEAWEFTNEVLSRYDYYYQ